MHFHKQIIRRFQNLVLKIQARPNPDKNMDISTAADSRRVNNFAFQNNTEKNS